MQDRKVAIINVSKGLMNISLASLTAIGGATGNLVLAGAAAIPQAVMSSGILTSLFEKKQAEPLEIPLPRWWTQEPQSASWQATCSSIEAHLSEIIEGVADTLRKETNYPSAAVVKHIFIEQVAQHLSTWEVRPQDRYLVAGYVTPLLLAKSAIALKAVINTTREDALATYLLKITDALDAIQQSTTTSIASTALVMQTNILPVPSVDGIQSPQTQFLILEQKRQSESYDVYICYDETDQPEVMAIADKLKAHGILPWLDVFSVKPGTPEKRQQEEQIRKIPAAVVVVGQQKIVDVQELQMYSFIDEFVVRAIPVIPAILTSAPKDSRLPPYLGNFGRVDFRRSVPEPLGQLIWGITGQRP